MQYRFGIVFCFILPLVLKKTWFKKLHFQNHQMSCCRNRIPLMFYCKFFLSNFSDFNFMLTRWVLAFLSREDFQRIPELAINPLGDRIINAFFPEGWVSTNWIYEQAQHLWFVRSFHRSKMLIVKAQNLDWLIPEYFKLAMKCVWVHNFLSMF